MLIGLRGVGKTVLLERLRDLAEDWGWLAISIEAQAADVDGPATRRRLARDLLAAARRIARPRLSDRLCEAFGSIAAFSARAGVTGIEIGVTRTAGRADGGNIEIDLIELVEDVATALQDEGRGFAIFCDELQQLDDVTMAALVVAQHKAAQRTWPFFLVGAGLPNLPLRLTAVRSYAERLFAYRTIGALAEGDARRALVAPARAHGVAFTEDSLRELVQTSDGYPYFLQEYGQATWNVAPASPMTADDALRECQARHPRPRKKSRPQPLQRPGRMDESRVRHDQRSQPAR